MRWTDAKITRLNKPGMHNVAGGLGLYVNVTAAGSGSYIARYSCDGTRHEMGLGSTRFISLDQAIEAVLEIRRLLAKGGDPLQMRRHHQAQARITKAKELVSWNACVKLYLDSKSKGWAPGYAKRWAEAMARYAEPILGKLPVSAVDDQLVRQVLSPIWNELPPTASKLRSALQAVIEFAISSGLRPAGLNPARWKGHLEHVFADPAKIKPVTHQLALSYVEVPAFFAVLGREESEVARALQMIVLTGGRKKEVLRMTWAQLDFTRRVWDVPALNMKQRAEHHVPLSTGMIDILDEMRRRCGGHPLPTMLVFASSRPAGRLQKSLSEPATQQLISRLGFADKTTVHGFRASLRTFCGECTKLSWEACELMIGHRIGGTASDPYMRAELTAERRSGFEAWSQWLNGRPVDPSIMKEDSPVARRVA